MRIAIIIPVPQNRTESRIVTSKGRPSLRRPSCVWRQSYPSSRPRTRTRHGVAFYTIGLLVRKVGLTSRRVMAFYSASLTELPAHPALLCHPFSPTACWLLSPGKIAWGEWIEAAFSPIEVLRTPSRSRSGDRKSCVFSDVVATETSASSEMLLGGGEGGACCRSSGDHTDSLLILDGSI